MVWTGKKRKNSKKKSFWFLLFQLCYPPLMFNNRLQGTKGNYSHLVFEFIITTIRVGTFATRIDRNGQAMIVFDFWFKWCPFLNFQPSDVNFSLEFLGFIRFVQPHQVCGQIAQLALTSTNYVSVFQTLLDFFWLCLALKYLTSCMFFGGNFATFPPRNKKNWSESNNAKQNRTKSVTCCTIFDQTKAIV